MATKHTSRAYFRSHAFTPKRSKHDTEDKHARIVAPPPISRGLYGVYKKGRFEMKDQINTHTPGPWECSDSHVYAYSDDIDEVICRLDGCAQNEAFFSAVPGRCEANARLVAAAPELLAALQSTVEYVEHCYECAFPDEDQNAAVLAAAKSAIAKALPLR